MRSCNQPGLRATGSDTSWPPPGPRLPAQCTAAWPRAPAALHGYRHAAVRWAGRGRPGGGTHISLRVARDRDRLFVRLMAALPCASTCHVGERRNDSDHNPMGPLLTLPRARCAPPAVGGTPVRHARWRRKGPRQHVAALRRLPGGMLGARGSRPPEQCKRQAAAGDCAHATPLRLPRTRTRHACCLVGR